MLIKNRAELATTAIRAAALDIIEAGIERVLPARVIAAAVKWDSATRTLSVGSVAYAISPRGRIFVIGGGKAAGAMAESIELALGTGNITDGVVICNESPTSYHTERIHVFEAGHPVPDQRGVEGVRRMLDLKTIYSIGAADTIICLISGGGSALMPCPVPGVSLEDKQKLTGLLLSCGADIAEINAVRKHLSLVKGGGLGAYFAPARVISLIISDVVGNDLSVIASGPTYPDPTTYSDAWSILRKYSLMSAVPRAILKYLDRGVKGLEPETPKSLHNCHNHIIADNRMALEAMAQKARELGLNSCAVKAEQTGDAEIVANQRAAEFLSGKYAGYDAILIGGETTPTLPAQHGKGGRNQHFAAVSMLAMEHYRGEWTVASVGTDGSDYMPDVAGAIVDQNTLAAANEKRLDIQDYLARYDSHTLLQKAGRSLIITGHTRTNVGDIILYMADGKRS